ncbi:MAG TPA: metallopeptidase TldD-related protein [Steroidobacteraceae bacterium]|nr:metallopeptidase TldD-related protein [Steroidobacteraceae bacterium]
MRVLAWGLLCLMTAGQAAAGPAPYPLVLGAEKAELTRSMEQLKKQPVAPYFLSYDIVETRLATVVGSFGALDHSSENRSRLLRINLRVGDYALDNTRRLRGGPDQFARIAVPIEDDPTAIRSVLWYQTDKKYRQAVQELATVRTVSEVNVEREDKSADFSAAPAEQSIEPVAAFQVDRKLWGEKVRKYTAPFQRFGNLYDATATFLASEEVRWFVSSDGAAIQSSQTYYRLQISAFSKADDGMELPRYETYFAFTPAGLPDDATVLKAVNGMIADLAALRNAPIVDPYTGPAILSGRAAAVFFHEVFGHRIEGHRQKSESEGQTFKKMVGQAVLPDFLSVVFDPTLRRYAGTDLVGAYAFDDEGVRARRVDAVSDGVMRNFLMSRTPIEGFPGSNGHGRAQPGFSPVARQSNLLVLNSKPISHDRLRAMLIEQIKQQNKPFGLLFDDIAGGFTITGRTIPNAFNVLPVMVYRIYPDGREELVRGVDLIGTPLTVFSKILAAGDDVSVFNGVCGAESGYVPVAASAPAILVSQIEVQKKSKSQERAPILPAPFEDK